MPFQKYPSGYNSGSFFFSSRRRHTRWNCDWSSDVCSSDLEPIAETNLLPYAGCGSWEEVYAGWSSHEGQYYWKDLPITTVPLDRSHYERRDARSEERRVGKECRSRGSRCNEGMR